MPAHILTFKAPKMSGMSLMGKKKQYAVEYM